jgi:glycerol-3-phosphate acyltransferase PlsX
MIVALDAMGGDFAPRIPVAGALAAIDEFENLEVILVGREDLIRVELASADRLHEPRIRIEDTPDIIEMTDSPGKVIRSKPNSSLLRALISITTTLPMLSCPPDIRVCRWLPAS